MKYNLIVIICLALLGLNLKNNNLKKFNIKKKSSLNKETVLMEYKNNFKHCQNIKRWRVIFIIISILFVISELMIFYFENNMNINIFLLLSITEIFLFSLFYNYSKKKYKQIFREEVIKPIIVKYDDQLSYSANDISLENEYCYANFERFDYFESCNYISGTVANYNFYFSNIKTLIRDYEAPKRKQLKFNGGFSFINLNKNYNNYFYFLNKKFNIIRNKNFIKIDNSSFMKKHDIFSDSKLGNEDLVNTMAAKIVELEALTGVDFEMKISDNNIAFRFHIPELFNPYFILNNEKDFVLSLTILEHIKLIIKETIYILD